jgi:hypothetical protein
MSTQTMVEQIRWQDLKVRSEVDLVLEIAQKEGWKDCEVFGHGDMITEPQDSMGWKLIPADLYTDSIPPEAVERLYQLLNAGIRVQGVIIADDERRTEPPPVPADAPVSPPAPAKPGISLSFMKPVASWIGTAASFAGEVLVEFLHSVGTIVSWIGKILLGLICVAGVICLAMGAFILLSAVGQALIHFWPVIPIGLLLFGFVNIGTGSSSGTSSGYDYEYDPKLVILVDDGTGGNTWLSLFTWYD